MSITENVRMARQKINAAAESAGRSGSEVRLLAATKMNGPEAVQEAIRAGVDICAENRVQEFLSKRWGEKRYGRIRVLTFGLETLIIIHILISLMHSGK